MVKVSKGSQPSKNIKRVLRSTKIPLSPIEELTYPVQMDRLEPWIKQIYGQTKLTSGNFSGPLKADSQYNDKEEHQPISDWSAKYNKEYYDNMLDLSLDWGEFNQPTYGSDKTHPVWYPRIPKKPKPKPGQVFDFSVVPPGTFLNYPLKGLEPVPKPKPTPIPPDIAGKDWYNLKWNKITQGTFQGDFVSFLRFWIGDKNQIRKGFGDDIIVIFQNPYVGLNTRYSKGILVDGLVFDTATLEQNTTEIPLSVEEVLTIFDSLIGERVNFIGELSNDVILHDTTHGDHEPALAYKHIPLKDSEKERAKKDTNRIYWKVESFKVMGLEGGGGLGLGMRTLRQRHKIFLAKLKADIGVDISEDDFLRANHKERQKLYDMVGDF